jgi:prevent-host-death family protein
LNLVKMTRNLYPLDMEKFVSLTQAKAEFSALIEDAVRGDDVIITKHGKPIAKIIKYEKPKVVFGLLEGKYPEWEKLDPSEPWLSDEALAFWRKKTTEPLG